MITKNVIVEVRGLPITLSDNVKAMGIHGPVSMSTKDIFTCIASGAYVYEVQQDGSKKKLDFTNYDKVEAPQPTNPDTKIKEAIPKEQPQQPAKQQQNQQSGKYNKNNKHRN